MKTTCKTIRHGIAQMLFVFLVGVQFGQTALAASTDIADVPMAVKNSVTPNLLVTYDNSESMDALMGGALIDGTDPNTRGNIGRSVMRNAMQAYSSVFNWGLMTYGTSGLSKYDTWVYYIGDNSTMLFTDDCVGYVAGTSTQPATPGVSATNLDPVTGNPLKCVANPQPFSPGGAYVTFGRSSDDPDIQDVLYAPSGYSPVLWGLANTGTSYHMYQTHSTGSGNSWLSSAFSGSLGTWTFYPTDSGFLASSPSTTRQLYVKRAWGYLANITGDGTLNEPVQADSTTHDNTLQALMANETSSTSSSEIKNSAVFTPLKGTLDSAKTYFSTSYQGNNSPIAYSCQQNFVMMVTDGMPTGTTGGNLYSTTDRTNPCTTSTSGNCSRDVSTATWSYGSGTATATWPDTTSATWTFGTAATDAIDSVTALRSTTNAVSSTPYDIETYVVALGDTVNNSNALAVMNAMAYAGGTGKALLALDLTSFQSAITTITDGIISKIGSAAAVSTSNAHVTATDNTSFASSYNSGTWTGDLNAYAIDTTTGLPGTTSLWSNGSAQTQLDLRTPASRYIATSTDTPGTTGGVQFEPTTASTATKLSTAQQSLLNTPGVTPADGAAVLAYLRGDRTGESPPATYRVRAHLMGDAVNAEPVYVGAPIYGYADAGYQGSSSMFKETYASRTPMVYQATNDGMLHAFNASTGAEAWAYIPNLVMGKLNGLTSVNGFVHQYLVDGTPVAGDVDFKNCCESGSGTDWHTILVGGLGKGGRGYYALDVTNPDATSEAAVASKVLWEFPNSITNTADRNSAIQNTGYTFGKPIIVKTAATGWVVLVTSGYNNGTNPGDSGGDGLGHLYVLNPMTGDLIKDIPTPGCSTTPTATPCGLAQISAYSQNSNVDDTTDYVYGGDLMGNVWRFDLTGNSTSSWGVSLFAVLRDASGATQPITTAPELAEESIAGISYRYVFVGTGEYLGDSDVPCPASGCPAGKATPNSHATQTQTMYGLVDDLVNSLPDPLRPSLLQQTVTTSGTSRTVTANTINLGTQKGWYVDLPDSGERINTDPALALGTLIFTSNIPNTTMCDPGGSSWEYFLDYRTGGMLSTSTFAATFLGNALASRPVVIQLPSGKVVSLGRLSNATTNALSVPTLASGGGTPKRISWREIDVQ